MLITTEPRALEHGKILTRLVSYFFDGGCFVIAPLRRDDDYRNEHIAMSRSSTFSDTSTTNWSESRALQSKVDFGQALVRGENGAGLPPKTLHSRLLFVCHAESLHNRYSNLPLRESGLTAKGWEQAEALSAWLRTHVPVDILIAGRSLPCQLTAQRIQQTSNGTTKILHENLPPCPDNDWAHNPPFHNTPIDGELSLEQAAYVTFLEHYSQKLSSILQKYAGQTIAIIENPSSIAIALRQFFGGHSLGIQLDSTGISELVYDGEQWHLISVNQREHLPRPVTVPPPKRPAEDVESPCRTQDDLIRRFYDRLATRDAAFQQPSSKQMEEMLLNFARLQPGLRILHVGSGAGTLAIRLAANGAHSVVGIDLSPGMLERAEYLRLNRDNPEITSKVSFRLAPARALPFPDDSFDAAVCHMVIHHMRSPETALKEIRRVLKPEGVLIFGDVASSEDPVKRATHNAIEARRNPSHVSVSNPTAYQSLLTNAGFFVNKTALKKLVTPVDEWLAAVDADDETAAKVREMMEASIETDAAGLGVRKEGDSLSFEQRLFYARAMKT